MSECNVKAHRTCLDCKFWDWSVGDHGYSELTPGTDARMECLKGHWSLKPFDDGRMDVLAKIKRAIRCEDFTPDEATT